MDYNRLAQQMAACQVRWLLALTSGVSWGWGRGGREEGGGREGGGGGREEGEGEGEGEGEEGEWGEGSGVYSYLIGAWVRG